ncbi:MAG: hypothetical protein MJZ75_00325 [Paludibacteraceae bacterium]|nr:hypothetical protein [Paludibacteraceae bacterium]
MKKFFFFASAMVAALTMNAQTITIDGNNSDWANIPMVTEPGTYPVLKFTVNAGSGNAFAAMLEQETDNVVEDAPVFYVDADKSAETYIDEKIWTIASMGQDYEMASWTGTAAVSGKVYELVVPTSSFTSIPFSGSCNVQMTYNWGAYYLPSAPDATLQDPLDPDSWCWSENQHHPFEVGPADAVFTNLNGTHNAADAKFTHKALACGSELNFNLTGGSQDTAFWAAWPVELTAPGTYTITMAGTFTETNTGFSFDLVDVATNAVVASIANNYPYGTWSPASGFQHSQWDLSAVPAGKYMLKMKNFCAWATSKVTSVTLINPNMPTGFDRAETEIAPAKMIRNGRFMIKNGDKYIHALGF